MSDEYKPILVDDLSQDELKSLVVNMHEELFLNRNCLQKLEAENRKFDSQRLTDPLTLIGNRRKFELDLERLAARRNDGTVGMFVIDLDFFKKYNDEQGHLAGDAVLKEVATTIQSVLRPADAVYRYGGDEFVAIIIPHGREEFLLEMEEIAKRICESIAELGYSVSIGIAKGRFRTPLKILFAEADSAVYRAKERGRGQAAGATAAHKILPEKD